MVIVELVKPIDDLFHLSAELVHELSDLRLVFIGDDALIKRPLVLFILFVSPLKLFKQLLQRKVARDVVGGGPLTLTAKESEEVFGPAFEEEFDDGNASDAEHNHKHKD